MSRFFPPTPARTPRKPPVPAESAEDKDKDKDTLEPTTPRDDDNADGGLPAPWSAEKIAEFRASLVKRQYEHYLGDGNMLRDAFLLQKLDDRSLPARDCWQTWIPLAVFNEFRKVKELDCSHAEVCAALKDSEVVDTDGTGAMIRRKKPFPADKMVFVSGIPEIEHGDNETLFAIKHVLTSAVGRVFFVNKYFDESREFKGVYAEFSKAKAAARCIDKEVFLDGWKLEFFPRVEHLMRGGGRNMFLSFSELLKRRREDRHKKRREEVRAQEEDGEEEDNEAEPHEQPHKVIKDIENLTLFW